MKSYKVFGRKFFPALLIFQLGFHIIAIPVIIVAVVVSFLGDGDLSSTLCLLLLFSLELIFFLNAFNEKLAQEITKCRCPKVTMFY
jgi:predicted membrane protein